MKFVRILMVFLTCAKVAYAEPVAIRTGEHTTFTRVVLFIPDSADWRVDPSDAGYVVRLPVSDGYDLSGFFDLIPKTRIAAVSQRLETGELELTLSCVCNATSYLLREGVLVIDVSNGLPASVASTALDLRVPATQSLSMPTPMFSSEIMRDRTRVVPLFPDQTDESLAVEIDLESEVQLVNQTHESNVSDFEEQISQALGAGLTGNLLKRDLAIDPPQESHLREAIAATRIGLGDLPGVEARTGIDPMTAQGETDPAETQTGRHCLPDAYFAVKNWGDDRSFNAQVGAARVSIYQEFDRIDEVAVTSLAQTFLYFGFGQEALQTLQMDQLQSQERRYLGQMARIIDNRNAEFSLFEEQVSCSSNVALWALLASENQPLDAPVARDAILRSFKELPSTLQGAVGPRLSRAFVRLGDVDAGSQVLSRIEIDAAGSADSAVAASVFASAAKDETGAIAALEGIIFDSTKATPELMVQYFETGLDAARGFRSEDFALSNALRFQAAGSENYVKLTDAQIRAHIASDQFEEALSILQRERNQLPDALIDALERQFATQAVERMSDGAFGRFAWSDKLLPAAPDLRQMIAERLFEMGFPGRAVQVAKAEEGQLDPPDPNSLLPEVANASELEATELAEPSSLPALVERADNLASLGESRNLVMRSADLRQELIDQLQAITIPEYP